MSKPPATPDQAALAAVGARVRQRLAADPAVYRVPADDAELFAVADFLAAAECDHLIGLVDATARPSPTYDEPGAGASRTSYSGDVDPRDSFVRMVERRICDLLGLDPAWGETVQGQRYRPGEQFLHHYDWFNTAAAHWPAESRRGGQRSWTAMIYLSDVEAGGTTDFPNLNVAIPPQRGTLLAWNNARPDGTPNPATLHAARPVERGVKYVVTKWFRTRPWG